MNPDYKPNLQQEIEIEYDSSDSIDDFIKELEAKEKDLHISSEMVVEIEEFKRTPELLRIGAIIWVEREGQKQIVIGGGGQVLKQVGSRARAALEELFEQKVFLRTWVKVSRDWSDNEKSMRQLGFDEFRG